MRFYCAGDDSGGVSLWRIFPRPAPSAPSARHHTGDQDMDRDRGKNQEESKESGFLEEDNRDFDNDDDNGDEDENEGESSIAVGSVLQCFLNVNCLPRLPDVSVHNSYEDTKKRNNEGKNQGKQKEKEERIVTLQFLPNSELLLVGTNKRLLLIVVGTTQDFGPSTEICGDVWNVSSSDPFRVSSGAFSPHARELSLSQWLSQSPTPYRRQYINMNMNSFKDSEMTFVSWVELDHVPPYCEGIFSMSVGSKGEKCGDENSTDRVGCQGLGLDKEKELSIFLWKVVVQSEVPTLDREGSKSSDMVEIMIAPRQADANPIDKSKSKSSITKPDKRKGGSLFSLPTFFSSSVQPSSNSSNVHVTTTSSVPVPALAFALQENRTPKKAALNLNLKEEKETPCVRADSRNNNNRTNARSNFDFEVDDVSDCRVYRLKWTEEMFRTAFKNSKAIPQAALEDHLSKIF